jgi:hypothetical protein
MVTVTRRRLIERVQTGVRMEKRLLKVLKALAEVYDLSLGDLLEGIVLHAFEGKPPFDEAARARIAAIEKVYGLDLEASDSQRLVEKPAPVRKGSPAAARGRGRPRARGGR